MAKEDKKRKALTESLERLAESIENSDAAKITKELNNLFGKNSPFFKKNDASTPNTVDDDERIIMAKAAFNAMGVLLTSPANPTKTTKPFVQKLTINILKEIQSGQTDEGLLKQAVDLYLSASIEAPSWYSPSPSVGLAQNLNAIQDLTKAIKPVSEKLQNAINEKIRTLITNAAEATGSLTLSRLEDILSATQNFIVAQKGSPNAATAIEAYKEVFSKLGEQDIGAALAYISTQTRLRKTPEEIKKFLLGQKVILEEKKAAEKRSKLGQAAGRAAGATPKPPQPS